MNFTQNALSSQILQWLDEDDLLKNFHYLKSLPETPVKLSIKIKSDLIMAGSDYFAATFVTLGANAEAFQFLKNWDGRSFKAGEVIEVPTPIPFNIALKGERLALNLLQHGCSIATWTKKHVEPAHLAGIAILDTRKTTPGLRTLEKYAVRVGGGHNHRFSQADTWMIKDNHKTCMGGLSGAYAFFKLQQTFYTNVVAEIHDLSELKEAIELGITHVMLDNFSPSDIKKAVEIKKAGMTYEISGGINLKTLPEYLMPGVDAISSGSLTYSAPRVDISLKFRPA